MALAAQFLVALIACALTGPEETRNFFTWWSWRRWNIYVPKGDYSWLGWDGLFDYDEYWVSPCSMNEVNCGTRQKGQWVPKIKLMMFEIEEET